MSLGKRLLGRVAAIVVAGPFLGTAQGSAEREALAMDTQWIDALDSGLWTDL